MTDIDLDRLKQMPVPPPRPEARARALAAAMQAFEPAAGASRGSVQQAEGAVHRVGAGRPKQSAWLRRETYALAASVAVLAIGLPVAVNHMGERQSPTPEPVAVVQKEVARSEAVTLLPQTAAETDTAKAVGKSVTGPAPRSAAAPNSEPKNLTRQAPFTGPAPAPAARAQPNVAAAPARSALAPTKPAATAETPLATPGAAASTINRDLRSATNLDPKAKTPEPLAPAAPAAKAAAQIPRYQAPWTQVCGREVLPDGKPGEAVCHVMTWISDGPQSGLFAIGLKHPYPSADQSVTLTLEFVHPAPDLHVMIDGVAVPLAFKPATCTPDACLREAELTPEILASLYRAGTLRVTSGTPSLGQRSVVLSLQGLTAAMMGPKASAADAEEFLAELEIMGWRSAFRDQGPKAKAVNREQHLLSVPQLFAKRIKLN